MPLSDSVHEPGLDPAQIRRARKLLATPVRKERVWPALASAGLAATAALALATAMILAPPVTTTHIEAQEP
jgi:hypothetical protein